MKNINVRTINNSSELNKHDVFCSLGGEGSKIICNFNINTDEIEIDNNLHGIVASVEPVANNGDTNIIGIMLSHTLLNTKSSYSVADEILKVNKFLNTEENKIIGITLLVIVPSGMMFVYLSNVIENNEIFKLSGILSYLDTLINNDMVETIENEWIEFKPREVLPEYTVNFVNEFMSTSTILSKN